MEWGPEVIKQKTLQLEARKKDALCWPAGQRDWF